MPIVNKVTTKTKSVKVSSVDQNSSTSRPDLTEISSAYTVEISNMNDNDETLPSPISPHQRQLRSMKRTHSDVDPTSASEVDSSNEGTGQRESQSGSITSSRASDTKRARKQRRIAILSPKTPSPSPNLRPIPTPPSTSKKQPRSVNITESEIPADNTSSIINIRHYGTDSSVYNSDTSTGRDTPNPSSNSTETSIQDITKLKDELERTKESMSSISSHVDFLETEIQKAINSKSQSVPNLQSKTVHKSKPQTVDSEMDDSESVDDEPMELRLLGKLGKLLPIPWRTSLG
ncbi:hypothetical protein BKA69DRAFT_1046426 [Paraphysoderma sedebokerense]|nr:hypothetical protein BKA69DRAFT_1046426 [Paraphysoderma sedebokerense]